jgi:hypothetical protein
LQEIAGAFFMPQRNQYHCSGSAFNYRKKNMFDKTGQWIPLETFDEFDNGLSDLIELWSSTAKTTTKTIKESALAHFKEDLEAATLQWEDNKAKSKKYAAIAQELAEFEEALKQG